MSTRRDKFNLRKVKTVPRGRKTGHKGKACRRGVPVYYDELKQRISLTLTPSAISHLEKLSTQEGFSCSCQRWIHLEGGGGGCGGGGGGGGNKKDGGGGGGGVYTILGFGGGGGGVGGGGVGGGGVKIVIRIIVSN
jgi:hypothetical protein